MASPLLDSSAAGSTSHRHLPAPLRAFVDFIKT
jgi:hypothetical protein